MMADYTTDPWENLNQGVSPDSEIYTIGGDIYTIMESVAFSGILVSMILTFVLIWMSSKKREEGKERFFFVLLLVILITALPGILLAVSRLAEYLL